MQKAASTSRFLIDLSFDRRFLDSESVVNEDRSLQRVVLDRLSYSANPTRLFSEVARRLIRLAEHAYTLRDTESLEEASRILMNLPLAQARQVGLFYQALTLKRTGDVEQAQRCFELIADKGPLSCRARAFQALGALHFDAGQPDEALRLQLEAARTASKEYHLNPLDILMVQFEISHIQAHGGDHYKALASLEGLAPLVRVVAKVYPLYFYLYHNALAVEFCDLGRLAEAEAACAVALASPFAQAYPEWSETRDEIAAKRQAASPSVVAIRRALDLQVAPRAKSQRASKPNAKPRTNSRRNPNLVIRFVFPYSASHKDFFQRSVFTIPAKNLVFNAVSILARLLDCVGPRAPPDQI